MINLRALFSFSGNEKTGVNSPRHYVGFLSSHYMSINNTLLLSLIYSPEASFKFLCHFIQRWTFIQKDDITPCLPQQPYNTFPSTNCRLFLLSPLRILLKWSRFVQGSEDNAISTSSNLTHFVHIQYQHLFVLQ